MVSLLPSLCLFPPSCPLAIVSPVTFDSTNQQSTPQPYLLLLLSSIIVIIIVVVVIIMVVIAVAGFGLILAFSVVFGRHFRNERQLKGEKTLPKKIMRKK